MKKDGFFRARLPINKIEAFKRYCMDNDTTMSTMIERYVDELVGEVPLRVEKNSVEEQKEPVEEEKVEERTELTVNFFCPYCGKDITDLSDKWRQNHLQNCKNGVFDD